MIIGTMQQRLIAPHLSKPIHMPDEMKEYIEEYHKRKEDERNSRGYVQREDNETC